MRQNQGFGLLPILIMLALLAGALTLAPPFNHAPGQTTTMSADPPPDQPPGPPTTTP